MAADSRDDRLAPDSESGPGVVLALGGHLKNTVAVGLPEPVSQDAGDGPAPRRANMQVVLSAHVGDLDSVASVEVFRRAIDDLLTFFHVRPDVIACDLHPDYASTRHAESLAASLGVPLLRFQHHHAHVAAGLADPGLAGPVLGF